MVDIEVIAIESGSSRTRLRFADPDPALFRRSRRFFGAGLLV
jgi:hypothetical protein